MILTFEAVSIITFLKQSTNISCLLLRKESHNHRLKNRTVNYAELRVITLYNLKCTFRLSFSGLWCDVVLYVSTIILVGTCCLHFILCK